MKKSIYGSNRIQQEQGYALFVAMMLIVVMGLILAVYHSMSSIELATVGASVSQEKSFYSAEAALNARAEEFRQVFDNFGTPAGTHPNETNPCIGGNNGAGDFICKDYTFGNNLVKTYVLPDASNPTTITIPSGEDYAGLYAIQNGYTIYAEATRGNGSTGAILGLEIKSRSVPIYQFAIFGNHDVPLHPVALTVSGPIHVNGDLYLDTPTQLDIYGQITVTGSIYRGTPMVNQCDAGPVRIAHQIPTLPLAPAMLTVLPAAYDCPGNVTTSLGALDFAAWNGMVRQHSSAIQVPSLSDLDPIEGSKFWDAADIRLVLKVDGAGAPITANSATGIEVRTKNNSVDVAKTNIINACTNGSGGRFNPRPVTMTNSSSNASYKFYNQIKDITNVDLGYITMQEIDLKNLLQCLRDGSALQLDDTSSGGLVFYLTVEGPNSSGINNYGIRIWNAAELGVSGGPNIKGLTIVSNQSLYTVGNFNSINKIPAALISDSYNVLSGAWDDSYSTLEYMDASRPVPTNTTINAALVTSIVYLNGGFHNLPRLHENWINGGAKTLTLLGSMVYLNPAVHSNIKIDMSPTGHYYAPTRNFNFDTSFNNPSTLPPVSSQFSYIKQTLFTKDFESRDPSA